MQDAFTNELPIGYFTALYDTPEEAHARYNVYCERIASARRKRREGD